ncbi:Reverse transcriptase zinc-binding domain [Macleaya cordata]|uniref:Reverse transcriptase zinc-binding domain n=1 Tax=Macleaya cordata TaxID=56857 RepID=A0A200QY47_MACCD|nr:Reverse transcriptase zinc-binding domain [Macleaya cordata]
MLAKIIGIKNQSLGDKYLGAPIHFLKSKTQTHLSLLKSIESRIASWSARSLSQAGRSTLVKHVGQAASLYQMASFLIPKNLCRKIDSHLCKFWWGESLNPNDKKLHLIAWDKICKPKAEGGLGFRKSDINNLAMLARNVWKLVEDPNSFLATTLKARYFRNSDFLQAKCPRNASWAWKCIHSIKEKIKPFISWIVGDGQFIDPWCDHWIPEVGTATPKPNTVPNPNIRVADFIEPISRSWDRNKLREHFDQSSIEKIVSIPLSNSPSSDRRAWDLTRDGRFTTKSAYVGFIGQHHVSNNVIWKHIWRTKVPHRIQLFAWKTLHNAIPVREILNHRILIDNPICPRCDGETETALHALITCPGLSQIWSSNPLLLFPRFPSWGALHMGSMFQ